MAASELLMTVGATPATPASGKQKLFFNSSKQLSQVDDAGLVSPLLAQGATAQASPGDPTGTTNTTGLMMGLAGAFTPIFSGRILIVICGDVQNNTLLDGAKFQIRYGTGTAPANAAALTGNAVGGLVNMISPTNAARCPFSLNALVTGLTLATAIWIDVSLAAVTGGTAAIKNVSISVIEI